MKTTTTKTIYYIECTCIKDCTYPNVDFHVGDVVYYNPKAASNEMYLYWNYRENRHATNEEMRHYGYKSHLPYTRQKKNAKKWEIKRYANNCVYVINDGGEFNAVVKEIKLTYTVEEN